MAIWHDDGWRIAAGCRWFTVAEAREHWGDEYEGDDAIRQRYVAALDWLAEQVEPAPDSDGSTEEAMSE